MLAAYRHVIAIKPDDHDARNNLGLVLADMKRLPEAEYREAIRLRPDSPNAYPNLGGLLIETCRPQDAEAVYRQGIANRPGDGTLRTLDQLSLPAQLGASRISGIDVNKPRIRAALAAAAALAPAPGGLTVADFAARVQAMTGQDTYTIRQAAYDLRKLRGKNLAAKPGTTRRYQVPPDAARTIITLLTLRDHVIAPILARVRSPRVGRKPKHWTDVDRDYETLRIGMQTLFRDLAIETPLAA